MLRTPMEKVGSIQELPKVKCREKILGDKNNNRTSKKYGTTSKTVNICIIGIQKEEEKEQKKYLNYFREHCKINDTHQNTGPETLVPSKINSEITWAHHIQTEENQKLRKSWKNLEWGEKNFERNRIRIITDFVSPCK